ncbi:unnamed protein product, partial [Pylaiella littoralis]
MLVSDFGHYSSGGGRSDKAADGTSDCGGFNSHRDAVRALFGDWTSPYPLTDPLRPPLGPPYQ